MAERSPNRKVASSLVALSSAAILAVYAVGYVRTKRAADRFDLEEARRRRIPVRPLLAARDVRAAVPAPPAVFESPDLERGAAATPRPTPKSRPSPPPKRARLAVATASPLAAAAQASAAEPASAPGGGVVAAPPPEPVDGDAVPQSTPLPSAPAMGPQPADGQETAGAYADGTYQGWGSCRHGDIQAEVVIAQGRIVSARISQCRTRYPCSLIERLAGEVVNLQGPPVTYVSGASDSSDAFQYAVLEALSHAH